MRYQKTVEGLGPGDADEIVKGYDAGDDEYVLIDPKELDAIKLETKKTLELVQFVGACEISPLYFDKPYYLVPTDDLAQDAYRVIRDALRASEKVGLGQDRTSVAVDADLIGNGRCQRSAGSRRVKQLHASASKRLAA